MMRILAAAILLACAAPAWAADHIKATIPVLADTAYAMYHIAQDKGYFAAEGLDVDVVVAGGGVATPALISGDAQFTGSPGAAIPAILKGAPVKLVLVTQGHPSYQLWAGDPAIKTLADLKGRQIGVISRGDFDRGRDAQGDPGGGRRSRERRLQRDGLPPGARDGAPQWLAAGGGTHLR